MARLAEQAERYEDMVEPLGLNEVPEAFSQSLSFSDRVEEVFNRVPKKYFISAGLWMKLNTKL